MELERKRAKRLLQKDSKKIATEEALVEKKNAAEREQQWTETRKRERESTIEKEAEDRRGKENRKLAKAAERQQAFGRDEKDHQAKVNGNSRRSNISSLTREVYDTGGEKAAVEQLVEQELASSSSSSSVSSKISSSSSNRSTGGAILPKIAVECLAKWVICQDIAQHETEVGKTIVWDRLAKMRKWHSIWEGRQVIEGAPANSQDNSKEIEILSLTGEEEGETIMHATSDLKMNKRPFAILIDTKILQHVQNKKEPDGKSEFQLIHVLRPIQEGRTRFSYFSWLCWRLSLPEDEIFAESPTMFLREIEEERGFFKGRTRVARPMSVYRMVRVLAGKILAMKKEKSKIKKKRSRSEEGCTSEIFRDGAYKRGRTATGELV